jgi:hypothetical protein
MFSMSFGLPIFSTKADAWLGVMDDRVRNPSRASTSFWCETVASLFC